SGTRNLRPLWDRLRRPSGFAPHPDVGGLPGLPYAQGLRRAGRLRIRTHGTRSRAGEGEAASPARGKDMSDAVLSDAAHTPADASFLSTPEGAGQPNYTIVLKS